MKWYSKGQIGMIEMIMVMIVIMVLLVIGIVFYFKFSSAHIEKVGEQISEDKAAVIISTIAQLPEVECSYLGSRTTKACIDTVKLLALSTKEKLPSSSPGFIEHRKHYSNLFKYATIKFEQLYPKASEDECNHDKYSNPDYPELYPTEPSCGSWTIYDNPKQGANPFFRTMPVTLYYPSKGLYSFGQLKIFFY